ncbi:MAG: 30S ribosomal protein S12 methylthiotransferase RimO [Erysipelotrichaceae bacterium]|nr:30S ribosomal protein S12 methylthiotransferase RimO [Erysipelotrichaceae bacterium]
MKVAFISLGCAKNRVDSERLMAVLQKSGHQLVTALKEAQAIFVNTCGFIGPAKEEAIDTILEAASYKGQNCRYLVVTGCLVTRYQKQLEAELPEVDLFVGLDQYRNFSELVNRTLGQGKAVRFDSADRVLSTQPWFAYLKIAEGCNHNCSFCAIPGIRGKYVSEPLEDLVQQAKDLAEHGVRELILVAQDSSYYGYDLYQKRRLPDLLRELNEIAGLYWIRVLYLYPGEVDDALLDAFSECEKVLPYFDIPWQHASPKLLKSMARPLLQSGELMTKIKNRFQDPTLRTTLIVGYPNEQKSDFKELLSAVQRNPWDKLGAFVYSEEEGTAAALLKDDVSDEEKQRRFQELMTLQQSIAYDLAQKYVGQKIEVLVEEYDGLRQRYRGRTRSQAPDEVDGYTYFTSKEKLTAGTFVSVLVKKADAYDLYGIKAD